MGVLLHAFSLTTKFLTDMYILFVASWSSHAPRSHIPAPRELLYAENTRMGCEKSSSNCEDFCGRWHRVDSCIDRSLQGRDLPLPPRFSAVPIRDARAFVLICEGVIRNKYAAAWTIGALAQDLARRNDFFRHVVLRGWCVAVGGSHQVLCSGKTLWESHDERTGTHQWTRRIAAAAWGVSWKGHGRVWATGKLSLPTFGFKPFLDVTAKSFAL